MKKSEFVNRFSKLVDNKDLLEKLLSLHNCGIFEIDLAKNLLSIYFYNNHYYFGTNNITYNLDELYGLVPIENSDKLKGIIEKVKSGKKVDAQNIDIILHKLNNGVVSLNLQFDKYTNGVLSGVAIENPTNNPFHIDMMAYNNFFEDILTNSKIFLWRWNYKNKKQIFSKNYYEFLGYDPKEIELDFDTQKNLIHPDDIQKVEKQLNSFFLNEKNFYEIEFRIKRKDGSWRWLLSKGTIVKRDASNEPIELIGVHIDINEVKKLQAESESTKINFSNLIDLADDIICVKDGEGRWLLANKADIKLFNLENVDYFGKTDYDLSFYTSKIYKEAFQTCMVTDEIAWKKGGISRSDEKIPIDDQGNIKIFDVVKKPIFNDDGSRRALIVMGRDVTEKRSIEQIERKLAIQNKIIREFSVLLLSQKTIDNVIELLTKYLSELNNNIIVIATKLINNNILKISSIYPSSFLRMVMKQFPDAVDRIAIKLSDEYINNSKDKFKHFGVVHTNLYDASLQKLPIYC